jgi:hypothetical protein
MKIKTSIWFFNSKVLLSRDNLVNRNRLETRHSVFVTSKSQFFLLIYHLAIIVWRIVHMTFSITPKNITNWFANRLNDVDKNDLKQLWVGVNSLGHLEDT